MRNPLCLEAVKLCQEGLTQTEAAKRVGIDLHILTTWLHNHKAANSKKLFTDRICQHCGKSLAGMSNLTARKYCSSSCGNKAWYAEKNPVRKQMRFNPVLRAEALELYWGGLGGTAIAKHFGISKGTVFSWIHDFGGQRERVKTIAATRLKTPKQRLRDVENAGEWLQALRDGASENSPDSQLPSLRLVCDTVSGNCGMNQMVSIISECLKLNPLNGEVFAFCNKQYNIITTITWEEPVFNIKKIQKPYGSYPWPHEDFGKSIVVTSSEFEYMISFSKKRLKIV